MIFSSLHFLFLFLPVCVLLYYLSPKMNAKNIILIILSLAFYAFGEPAAIFLLIACTLINYLLGRMIGAVHATDKRFLLTATAVVFNVCVLVYFKLFSAILGGQANYIPLGVSFFTFQCIAYIVDVSSGKIQAQKNILDFSLFILMFPKLISGPIVRYDEIGDQIKNRQHSWESVSAGIIRFVIGLSKKVILADLAAGLVTSNLGASMSTWVQAWFGLLMFAFQLYFDFSGYSDMAIGLGKIFGFHYPENFKYPYTAVSISQFWRRWHITLGTFFRDYIYIPLGGNRQRHLFNLFMVWIVTALWHGVGVGFIMWGMYHFVLVVLDKKLHLKIPTLLSRIGTFLLVYFGWTFFYYNSWDGWLHFMRTAFHINGEVILSQIDASLLINNLPFVVLCFVAATPILPWLQKYIPAKLKQPLSIICVFSLLVICTALIQAQTYVPFLYSKF